MLSLSCNQKLGPRSHSVQTEVGGGVGGEAVNPCKAIVGFISCSLESNNYFIVMNACTTVVWRITWSSSRLGTHLMPLVSISMSLKNDAQCFHYGSAAVITSSWGKKKAKCQTRKLQFTWDYSDKNTNMDNASHSRRLIKTCICQRQDRNYSACAAATTTSNLHASVPRGSPVCPLPS